MDKFEIGDKVRVRTEVTMDGETTSRELIGEITKRMKRPVEGFDFLVVMPHPSTIGTIRQWFTPERMEMVEKKPAAPPLTLALFWDKLNRHDWYFMMSDDYRVVQRGQTHETTLINLAEQHGEEFTKMLEQFRSSFFTGENWGKTKVERPARPE